MEKAGPTICHTNVLIQKTSVATCAKGFRSANVASRIARLAGLSRTEIAAVAARLASSRGGRCGGGLEQIRALARHTRSGSSGRTVDARWVALGAVSNVFVESNGALR